MDKKRFYITTTLPYVNAEPHIGFAYEILVADAISRYKKIIGQEVFFNTGTDEHGLKIYKKALQDGKDPEAYVQEYSKKFKGLKDLLGLDDDLHFVRTHSPEHIKAAQELWKRCEKYIEVRKYKGLYCVGDEAFVKETDLVDGKCPNHPNLELEEIEEENYFFKLTELKGKLKECIEKNHHIEPEWARKEAQKFLDHLEDISISREKSKMPWGVPVPGDEKQVMYVWFDALTNYISTLGWPEEEGDFNKFWVEGETVQLAGKDQVRFQSIIWQAMLLAAGIRPTEKVIYHGFINSGGQKMSKSLGNVISPGDLVKKFGTEATRYLLLRHVHPTEDTDVTWEKLNEWYEAGLANGLGNLVARIMTLAEKTHLNKYEGVISNKDVYEALENVNLQSALDSIWADIQKLDEKISTTEPYKLLKTEPESAKSMIEELRTELVFIARKLRPFIPVTADIIHDNAVNGKKPENLFPRLNA